MFCLETKKQQKRFVSVFVFQKQVPPENVLEVFLFGKRAMFKVAFFLANI